ncbi:hypothetical protein PIB30_065227 [Stylosanthes scabra]|uniref:MAK10-like protein n=1 Tax=Stylosanthes scabra TaxID=79078 RepID=A0ABU6WPR4_9FABA|nr:hypothetical protein [Stylosanthes scabra]
MIDALSGGALMNKTLEEAWELIETVADANQHFNRRATSKGIHEFAPADSTVLAKSLVDIVAMLKEIKEGKQVTLTLLKQQPDDSQQKPIKHYGICSCNSHHTDKCPQLQEDNIVASTHNFYDATTNPPYNRKYYTQGGHDSHPTRWIPPQQRNKLNLGSLIPTISPRIAKMPDISLYIIISRGINAVQVEEEEDEFEDENDENDWLYEFLKGLANYDESDEEEDEDESTEEDSEDEFVRKESRQKKKQGKKIGIKERFSS